MLARSLFPAALLAAATASGVSSAPAAAPQPSVVAIVGGTIHVAPGVAPIRDGVLVVDGGRIAAVGPRARTPVPVGARVVDARGGAVLAAFWNAHVHLIGPQWAGIDTMAAPRAEARLRDAFGRFGFAHVADIGSFDAAPPLRRRIEAGELPGPEILTTLAPFVPRDGTPVYLPGMRLPELHDAAGARDSVRARAGQGADAIKLFVVPITAREPFPVMASEIVAAVADEAHHAGRLVFAHPTDLTGVRVAVRNGIDVLAHTVPRAGAIPASLLDSMRRRDVALVPTLMLCEVDYGRDTTGMGRFVRTAQAQLRAYAARGGRVLFGTDVGYVAEQDPSREYELMAGAGLDFAAILASLTTAPARAFGRDARTGRLAPGLDADVVVIDGDPTRDVRALARVRLTMRRGRVLYEARTAASD